MEEWKEYKLGELYDVHNGLSKGGKFFGSGYPFLSFSTVFKNYFLPQELTNLVQSSEKEQSNFSINEGDVFITRTSESADELGMSSVALKDYPNATYNGFTKRLRPKGVVEIYPKYIGYYLRSPRFRHNFYGITSSMSTRASLSNGDLLNMKVILPPYATQQKIANILSSLDDKIEVNRRINEQLEELASALFKFWFVDFEPFKDGEFVDSELGMIPKGWKVGKAEDFYKITIGKTPPRKEQEWFTQSDKDIKWVSISDMGNCGMFIANSSEYLTNEAIQKFNIGIVPKDTVLLSFKLTIGRVAIAMCNLTTNEAIARFYLPNDTLREYTYLMLKQYNYANLGSTSSIATAVNSKIIKQMRILMPHSDVLEKFSTIIKPLFENIKKNQQEIHHLTTLRDTLLPKLMSGEIDVNEVTL